MSESTPAPAKLPRLSFNIIFSASMMTTIGLTGMASVMPTIGRSLGVADVLVATVFSLSGLAFSVFAPFWAHTSDRYGRKPLMMLGTTGFVVSMACCAAAVMTGMTGLATPFIVFILLTIGRGLFGVLGSANAPATQAYVAEHTSSQNRTRTMASFSGASTLGTVVGPVLASIFILSPLGIAGPMTGFAIMGAIVLLMIIFLLPESQYRPEQAPLAATAAERKAAKKKHLGPPIWKDKKFSPFLIFALTMFVCQGAQVQTIGFLIIDKLSIDPVQAQAFIATAMIAGALGGTFAQWVLVRAFNMTPASLMFWGALAAAIGNLLNALQPSYASVAIGYATGAMGFAMARPGYLAGASLTVGKNLQARAAGAFSALAGVAAVTNPIFVGLYGYKSWLPFAICTVVMSSMVIYALKSGALRNAVPEDESDIDEATPVAPAKA